MRTPYWIDIIPEHWALLPARRVLDIVKEIPGPGASDAYARSSLTMRGVLPRDRGALDGLQPESMDSYQILRKGELVFKLIDLANVATSRVGLAGFTGLVSPAYIVARLHNVLDARFAFYYFYDLYLRRVYNEIGGDGVRSSIGPADLRLIPVPVPPLKEQQSIADFLDRETARIDTLINEQQRLIEMLIVRRRSVHDEIMTAVSDPRIKMKYLFEKSSENNQPGEQVLSVYRDHGVIPKNSRTDNFNRTPENVDRYLLVRPGDLAVNRMKAWQGALGISEFRGIVSGDYEVVRPKDDRLLPGFAHYLLRTPRMIAEYEVRSTGIRPSQWRLYWDAMGEIPVPIPSHAEQHAMVERIKIQTGKIDSLVAETERFIELSRERRAALITAAVTGQIDLQHEAA